LFPTEEQHEPCAWGTGNPKTLTSFPTFFAPDSLRKRVQYMQGAEVSQSEANTLTVIVHQDGPVKISFFGGLNLSRVQDPDVTPDNEIQVASMLDIAATKLATIQQRAQTRDYEGSCGNCRCWNQFGRSPWSCRCRLREGVQWSSQPESTYILRRWGLTQPQSCDTDQASGSGRPSKLQPNSADASKNRRDATQRRSEMNHPELQTVAKRMVWFKAPDDALKDVKLFLAHVMTYGTLSDITTTLRYFSEDDFEAVLNDPPAGIFDRRSWTYWNVRYRHDPVPPLPKRTLPL
jgi:hypothetical protein